MRVAAVGLDALRNNEVLVPRERLCLRQRIAVRTAWRTASCTRGRRCGTGTRLSSVGKNRSQLSSGARMQSGDHLLRSKRDRHTGYNDCNFCARAVTRSPATHQPKIAYDSISISGYSRHSTFMRRFASKDDSDDGFKDFCALVVYNPGTRRAWIS